MSDSIELDIFFNEDWFAPVAAKAPVATVAATFEERLATRIAETAAFIGDLIADLEGRQPSKKYYKKDTKKDSPSKGKPIETAPKDFGWHKQLDNGRYLAFVNFGKAKVPLGVRKDGTYLTEISPPTKDDLIVFYKKFKRGLDGKATENGVAEEDLKSKFLLGHIARFKKIEEDAAEYKKSPEAKAKREKRAAEKKAKAEAALLAANAATAPLTNGHATH